MPPKARIATVSTKTASIGMAFLVHGWAGPRPSGLPAAAPTASPSAAPATPPSAARPATAAHQPDDQQEYQRADGGVDDRRDKARADVDAELRKQPAPDRGAYDADNEVADEPKPGALHDLAGELSCNEADHQYDEETFTRHGILSDLE